MQLRRRRFLVGAGVIAASSLAWAQGREKTRRVAVLTGSGASTQGQLQLASLRDSLRGLGWIEGQNLVLEHRWGEGKAAVMRVQAEDLMRTAPEVFVVRSATALREVRRIAGEIPIVFVSVSNPVGNGFVKNLAHPGGNITGFSNLEFEMAGKWLQLLKESAPRLERVLALQSANNPSWPGWTQALEAAAPALKLRIVRGGVRAPEDIEPAIAGFVHDPNGGMVVLPDPFLAPHRTRVVSLAARYRVPAIYGNSEYVEAGALLFYGVNVSELPKRVGAYVSRILKGEKAGDLPVQAPTEYDLVVNMPAAKALGLAIPPSVLLRASRVIE
jgi:putative ABC transport system substrate-binding protein